eukprot:TRINITY_DN7119_c1_g1_i3.p3 TRINITY_DN7119_c1_g1~~TRINITY_DN7119_c1_g1_i3.p3  ORF type:complete len:104 (+),score=1.93 TRINITY_DN7119_c1_g1_i3:629-940(+)
MSIHACKHLPMSVGVLYAAEPILYSPQCYPGQACLTLTFITSCCNSVVIHTVFAKHADEWIPIRVLVSLLRPEPTPLTDMSGPLPHGVKYFQSLRIKPPTELA